MKNRIKFVITTIIVLFIVFFVTTISMTKDQINRKHYMFSDIELLDILSPYIIMPIENDRYLNDIVPLDCYSYKIKWEGKKYSVYAYEFEDSSQCMQYVTDRMKMNFNDESTYYLSSNVFFYTKYIAFADAKLIYIEGPDIKSTFGFLDYLEQNFDIDLQKKD